ncbi:cobyric acid synthase [Cellulosilyticum sp. ST5]|uniref:cobyric acid synthase n=1 Tax=Cellulosilyticum sp. ST5 TaxID=3055805 RepID=UPI0039776FD6
MGKSIMFQGTASNVGKSLLTAGFCRVFKQDGLRVIPFKSQNMALNSFITEEGLEMGRAQVFQAEAAGIKPSARMNPILLKPTSDQGSQVIVNGKVYDNMTAREYHEFKPQLAEMIKTHYESLSSEYDVVAIEGAGSPAEINLRDKDIVNMGMAEIADSPVILIADIDKGGVFASILGTIMLLTEEERARVKGVIINKFRGDRSILEPGIKMLEDLIKIPVLGVVPYTYLKVEDEDSLTSRFYQTVGKNNAIDIAIIHLPHISNFTDFNMLEIQEDVQLRYIRRGEKIGIPDLVILPGSKNTLADLAYLKESGLDIELHKLHEQGNLIMGICGGYQILGEKIADPYGVEGHMKEAYGLGLLPIETTFEGEKVTTQVEGTICKDLPGLLSAVTSTKVKGYEIHMGVTKMAKEAKPLMTFTKRLGQTINELEGTCNEAGNVFGTYLHGIFDEANFTRNLLNAIRVKKGLEAVENSTVSFEAFKQGEYDKLAQVLREHVDMVAIYDILGAKKK